MAEEKGSGEAEIKDASTASITAIGQKKKHPGIVSRIWNVIFNVDGNNLEKRLQDISKEESASLARMKRRSQTWRQMARNLIMFSVALEVIAVGYAIITTRVEHLEWKTRAFRVLPMFLLPVLASLAYSAFASFRKHCDRKDQSTLEHLRAERQEKIDELKEKTNYYSTQQLIQKYDTDPAAKAAAATVLASKLGADSGLKVLVRDESTNPDFSAGKSSDVELSQSNQLRRRRQPPPSESNSADSIRFQQYDEDNNIRYSEEGPLASSDPSQLVVGHYNPPAPSINDGGWIARIAALLVGEDPTQSYALICENCHMHNGLARKEDFEYITYYCPHCQALNRPKQSEEQVSGANTPSKDLDSTNNAGTYVNDSDLRQDHPVEAMSKMKEEEVTEKAEPVKLSF